MSVTLVGDKVMKRVHRQHMRRLGPTDVLSFPSEFVAEKNAGKAQHFATAFLGDVIISVDTARRQAEVQNIPLMREIVFLAMHAVLHLIGYDHATNRQRQKMQAREQFLWRKVLKC